MTPGLAEWLAWWLLLGPLAGVALLGFAQWVRQRWEEGLKRQHEEDEAHRRKVVPMFPERK